MILLIWQYRQSGGVPVRISRSCTPARTSRSFTHARISRSYTRQGITLLHTRQDIPPCTLARISCSCTHARISRALAHPPGYPTLAHTPGYMAFVPAYEPPLEHTPVFLDPNDPLNQHGLLSIMILLIWQYRQSGGVPASIIIYIYIYIYIYCFLHAQQDKCPSRLNVDLWVDPANPAQKQQVVSDKLKQLIKPPPGSHQIERISQTKNRTGLLV